MDSSSSSSSLSSAESRCQVDGCGADLSGEKSYLIRHRICEVHSKSREVVVYGRRCRFCQQCSRLHELGEFDGDERSCRKRLAGHNQRRRKSTSTPATLFPYPAQTLPFHPTSNVLSERRFHNQ